jgi:hypothetical protein
MSERKTTLVELLLCRERLDKTQIRYIGFLLERKVRVGIDDWRFYVDGPNSKRLLHDIEVMRGFGLVELLMEKTPYDYNRLCYCLTEKGEENVGEDFGGQKYERCCREGRNVY